MFFRKTQLGNYEKNQNSLSKASSLVEDILIARKLAEGRTY